MDGRQDPPSNAPGGTQGRRRLLIPDSIPHVELFGLPIWGISVEDLAHQIREWDANGSGRWIATLNLDYIARCARDPEFLRLISQADVFTADGMPVLRACQRIDSRFSHLERTTGADLTPILLRITPLERVAIVGGVDPAAAIRSVGLDPTKCFIFNGQVELTESWAEEIAAKINNRSTVFVALGCPKQEQMIALMRPFLPEAVFVAVGGSFELMSGMKSRAPGWMQRSGLEWLHRLMIEPKRLWRRYLLEYPPGALALYRAVRAAKRTASRTLPPS